MFNRKNQLINRRIFIFIYLLFSSFCYAKENVTQNVINSFEKLRSSTIDFENNKTNAIELSEKLNSFSESLDIYEKNTVYLYDITQNIQNNSLITNIRNCINSEENYLLQFENTQNTDEKLIIKNKIKTEYTKICNYMLEFYHDENNMLTTTNSIFSVTLLIIVLFVILSIILSIQILKYKTKTKENKQLLETIIRVQENERSRISQDLHDTVTQEIRSVLFYVDNLLEHSDSTKLNELNQIKLIQEQSLTDIRSIIKKLTPPGIEHSDFRTLVNEYCNQFTELSKIECSFFANENVSFNKLTIEQKLHLFRIIQEALQNIQKHSKAEECSVLFRMETNTLVLLITDDGTGFDVEKVLNSSFLSSDGTGLGLKGIQTRVKILNAHLTIKSNDIGTEIMIKLDV